MCLPGDPKRPRLCSLCGKKGWGRESTSAARAAARVLSDAFERRSTEEEADRSRHPLLSLLQCSNEEMGGSTNTVLHMLAISKEAGLDLSLDDFDKLSDTTPHICSIDPSGPHTMKDIDDSGGVSGVLKQAKSIMNDEMTVSGKSIYDIADALDSLDGSVIRPTDAPVHSTGGITILYGNLAEKGSVIKSIAVNEEMMTHEGPAKVFNSEDDAIRYILDGKVVEGEVLIIRYVGLKGAPGMPEMLAPTAAIAGMGYKSVALINNR